jgi:hypothetical protein
VFDDAARREDERILLVGGFPRRLVTDALDLAEATPADD